MSYSGVSVASSDGGLYKIDIVQPLRDALLEEDYFLDQNLNDVDQSVQKQRITIMSQNTLTGAPDWATFMKQKGINASNVGSFSSDDIPDYLRDAFEQFKRSVAFGISDAIYPRSDKWTFVLVLLIIILATFKK